MTDDALKTSAETMEEMMGRQTGEHTEVFTAEIFVVVESLYKEEL